MTTILTPERAKHHWGCAAYHLFYLKRTKPAWFSDFHRSMNEAIGDADTGTKEELVASLEGLEFCFNRGVSMEILESIKTFPKPRWVHETVQELESEYGSVIGHDGLTLLIHWVSSKSELEMKARGESVARTLIKKANLPTEKDRVLSAIATQILKGKRNDRWPDKPDPSDFYLKDSDWRQMVLNVHRGGVVMLVGPAGCGKSQLVSTVAKAMKRPYHEFSFGSVEARLSLIGSKEYSPERGTYFSPSRFATAIQEENSVILLDEFNRASADTLNHLFPVLDGGQRKMHACEANSVLNVAEGISWFLTCNLGMGYVGTSRIDDGLLDRVDAIVRMDYISREQEIEILMTRTGIKEVEADVLVKIASNQREFFNKRDFPRAISTRRLISCAMQISYGVPIREAISYTILNHFSDEGGIESDRARLQQLIHKFL